MTESEQGHDSSLILPLVKRLEAEGSDDPPPWPVPDADLPVLEVLTGYLAVAYVFDLPGHFEYVTARHCERQGLAARDLRDLAVRNLTRRRAKPQFQQVNGVMSFRLDGNLEASLLLVSHFWPQIASRVPGEPVAAVPSRDVLLVTGSKVPGGLAALGRGVEAVWRTSETRLLLTKFFYLWRDNCWEQFNPDSGLRAPTG